MKGGFTAALPGSWECTRNWGKRGAERPGLPKHSA